MICLKKIFDNVLNLFSQQLSTFYVYQKWLQTYHEVLRRFIVHKENWLNPKKVVALFSYVNIIQIGCAYQKKTTYVIQDIPRLKNNYILIKLLLHCNVINFLRPFMQREIINNLCICFQFESWNQLNILKTKI